MARQKIEDNLFYVIFRKVPTWATVVIVAASYPVLRWLLPALMHDNLSAQIGSAFAPYLAVALALIGLFAEADKLKRRRLVSIQSSLETLRGMTWLEFEHFVGEIYRQQGYSVEEKGGSGPDGGVDIVLRRGGETVLVQCKQWKMQSVGVKPVRELRGVVASQAATRGIFVTCGGYTSAALAEFADQPLELIDGPKLLKLVQEVQTNLPQTQQTLVAQVIAPSGSRAQAVDEATEPPCPRCGSLMRKKPRVEGQMQAVTFGDAPSIQIARERDNSMNDTITPYELPPSVKAELLALAAQSDLLLLGETHGTQEVPRLVLGLLDDLATLGYSGLGLEIPRGEGKTLAAWAHGGEQMPAFFGTKEFQDGRGNQQALSLVRQAASRPQPWKLLCFDADFLREGVDFFHEDEFGMVRDRHMAENLLALWQEECAGQKVVAVCGNYHSRLIAPEQPDFGPWPSFGANVQLLRPELTVSAVDIRFHGGRFFNGEVREFGPSSPPLAGNAELRLGGWLGHTAELHLPHATPATFAG